ncbi:MAG TPA: VOC family protein [Jatrophihabitantaceae bacterium]|nr:VOC family protein [Jatrophihabitantaceae bacterium]
MGWPRDRLGTHRADHERNGGRRGKHPAEVGEDPHGSAVGHVLARRQRHRPRPHRRLQAAGVEILPAPEREPGGLAEMWITDPDGVRIVLVEVPTQHPLRRDNR